MITEKQKKDREILCLKVKRQHIINALNIDVTQLKSPTNSKINLEKIKEIYQKRKIELQKQLDEINQIIEKYDKENIQPILQKKSIQTGTNTLNGQPVKKTVKKTRKIKSKGDS